MSGDVPASLTDPAMLPVWDVVRRRLELQGADNRGRVRLPVLDQSARRTLTGLLGRRPAASIDLATLERVLVELGVGDDLAEAVATLGAPVSPEADERRAARRTRRDAHAAARATAATWREDWVGTWIDDVVTTGLLRGLDAEASAGLVTSVRAVVDRVAAVEAGGTTIARTELAAHVLGDSHALDRGSALEAATSRALAHRRGDRDLAAVWDTVGVQADQVSAAALTWALPVRASSGLWRLIESAHDLAVPVHLTRFALRRHPVDVAPGTVVLVSENPRVVEAAAERATRTPVVTTNGNPSTAVRLLVEQLLGCGAVVRYHGDFDTPGLAIAERMQRIGLEPWRMDAADYRRALDEADEAGVALPLEPAAPGATPWDHTLADLFGSERRVVHEERVLDHLLGDTEPG